MRKLLHIDSSPSPSSVSRELTREFASTWKALHRDGEVIYRDLTARPPAPINADWIGAAYTPPAELSSAQTEMLAMSEELIGELESAEEYLIGVAMHNFSVPSVVKLWIDQIARRGRTFVYSEAGPQGLLVGKKATVVVASGGVYAPGTQAAAMDFIEPYLKAVLAFLGVTDVRFIRAGGTAQLMMGAVDRPEFLKPMVEQIHAAAV